LTNEAHTSAISDSSYKNKEIPVTELIVLYRMPNDPEHFEKYYREVHGPMTSKLPGLRVRLIMF
jgi:hypothetical protein